MKVVNADESHPGPGELRVAVHAAGVNALDWKIRSGQMQDVMPRELPTGLGQDAAGVVDEVGEGVTDVLVGDPVFGSGSNAYSQYVVLTAWEPMRESPPTPSRSRRHAHGPIGPPWTWCSRRTCLASCHPSQERKCARKPGRFMPEG